MTSLRSASKAHFGQYLEYAARNLAYQLEIALAVPTREATKMGEAMLRSVLPLDYEEIREGVFLCEICQEGEVVGTTLFGLQTDKTEPRYFVWDIVVEEAFRGQGIGSRAMNAIEERARQHRAVAIELSVFAQNTLAKKLYKRLGYRSASTLMLKRLDRIPQHLDGA